MASAAIIVATAPDILLLTEFDHDHDLVALRAFADALREQGLDYPHIFALPSNAGLVTGLDMDGNGRLGEARDAMGYGRFAGDGALAILSRYPIDEPAIRDFTSLLWRDLPGAVLPTIDGAPFPSVEVQAVQRLSTSGHWVVPIQTGSDPPLSLLVWSATPPVFDGAEDMNGLRNRDELRLWQHLLDGTLGPAPQSFAIIGNANLDPADGDGLRDAMGAFLQDTRFTDPAPSSGGGARAADPDQVGDPALDTADWPDNRPGNLRVTYVLPSRDWTVTGSGVFWPAPDDPQAALLGVDGLAAGPHRLVWVDIRR